MTEEEFRKEAEAWLARDRFRQEAELWQEAEASGKGDFAPMAPQAGERASAANAANVAAGGPGFIDYADAFATGAADTATFGWATNYPARSRVQWLR